MSAPITASANIRISKNHPGYRGFLIGLGVEQKADRPEIISNFAGCPTHCRHDYLITSQAT
jgi:hypothetical protein